MNKKKLGAIIFGIICVIFVIVCIIIQITMKKETELLKQEGEKYETLITETKSGESVETQYIYIEDNKFFIKVPTNFIQLDSEMINQKYSGNVPDVVFSNNATTINVAISITENDMTNEEIEDFNKYMEEIMKVNSEIVSTNYYTVDDHNVGQIKLISNAEDTRIYNNMICFSYNGKLVITTFNCTEALKDEWEKVGDFIIDSLFFTD